MRRWDGRNYMKDNVIGKPIREEGKLRYRGRNHSGLGQLSWMLGAIGWGILFLLVSEARGAQPDTGRIGSLAMLLLVLAVFGIAAAAKGMKESNVFYKSVLLGAVLNGTLAVTLFALYLIGAAG